MAARALATLVLLAGCAAAPTMQAGAPSACVLVDTDTGSDDMRAVAALLGRQHVVAIVTTAGIASAERGATVMAMLAAAAQRPVPVLVGASSTTAPAMDWLPAVRDEAERMDGELAASVPYGARDPALAADVARLTQDCARVDVVQIAPWSSFVVYAPALAGRLGQVLAQGRSPQARPAGNPGFNMAAGRPIGPTPRKAPSFLQAETIFINGLRGVLAAFFIPLAPLPVQRRNGRAFSHFWLAVMTALPNQLVHIA